jgi:hypothetical protein
MRMHIGPAIAAIVKRGDKDILKPEWLVDCIENSNLMPLAKR